jgi:hypothetical protein
MWHPFAWLRRRKNRDVVVKAPPSPHWTIREPERRDSGIEVNEIDTSEMTRTGVHRAFDRMRGERK